MHLAKRNFTYKMNDIPLNTVLEHDYLGVRLHYHRDHMLITYVTRPVDY